MHYQTLRWHRLRIEVCGLFLAIVNFILTNQSLNVEVAFLRNLSFAENVGALGKRFVLKTFENRTLFVFGERDVAGDVVDDFLVGGIVHEGEVRILG